MEMPSMCNCGNWFDLNDGHPSKENDRMLICDECHENELKPPKGKQKADLRRDDVKWFQTDDYCAYTKPHGYYQAENGKSAALCNNMRWIDLGNEEAASIHEFEENSEAKYACKKCQAIFNKLPY